MDSFSATTKGVYRPSGGATTMTTARTTVMRRTVVSVHISGGGSLRQALSVNCEKDAMVEVLCKYHDERGDELFGRASAWLEMMKKNPKNLLMGHFNSSLLILPTRSATMWENVHQTMKSTFCCLAILDTFFVSIENVPKVKG